MERIKDSVKYDKKLSIIVPVYNVEKYLERCVDSLLHQDLPHDEYEIILINDGSTDNSYEIAKRLAGEHDNIVLLTQENQGLSGARNTGLEHAKGKYIMFVDSDDSLLPNVIRNIFFMVEKYSLDVCNFRHKYFDQNGKVIECPLQKLNSQIVFDGRYAITHGAEIASVWRNVYSHCLLDKYQLRFLDKIYHQDVDFNLRMFAYADRMMFSDDLIYCYYYNDSAISRVTDSKKAIKHISDDFTIVRHIRDFSEQDEYGKILKDFYQKHGNSLLVSKLICMINSKLLSKEEKIQLFNRLIALGLYPVKGRAMSWKTTFLIPFLNTKRLIRFMF